jgi:hypothetical protein
LPSNLSITGEVFPPLIAIASFLGLPYHYNSTEGLASKNLYSKLTSGVWNSSAALNKPLRNAVGVIKRIAKPGILKNRQREGKAQAIIERNRL